MKKVKKVIAWIITGIAVVLVVIGFGCMGYSFYKDFFGIAGTIGVLLGLIVFIILINILGEWVTKHI